MTQGEAHRRAVARLERDGDVAAYDTSSLIVHRSWTEWVFEFGRREPGTRPNVAIVVVSRITRRTRRIAVL